MKQLFILLFLSFALLPACKKETDLLTPPDSGLSENPVFRVTGSINGESINSQAGVGLAYLETYEGVEHEIHFAEGRLVDGDNYYSIKLFEGNIGEELDLNDFVSDTLFFVSDEPMVYLDLSLADFQSAAAISDIEFWVDGISSGSSVYITEPGVYDICADVTFQDATQRSVCSTMKLGINDNSSFKLRHVLSLDQGLNCWIEEDSPVEQVVWYLDGVIVGNEMNVYLNFYQGVHVLGAEVYFENGTTSKHEVIVDFASMGRFTGDMTDFMEAVDPANLVDFKAQFEVRHNGQTYRPAQPAGAYALVKAIAWFGLDNAGRDVYRIDAEIHTAMKNISTQQVTQGNFDITFGLTIPK